MSTNLVTRRQLNESNNLLLTHTGRGNTVDHGYSLDTSHFEISPPNDVAPQNISSMSVTLDTSHFEMSPLNAGPCIASLGRSTPPCCDLGHIAVHCLIAPAGCTAEHRHVAPTADSFCPGKLIEMTSHNCCPACSVDTLDAPHFATLIHVTMPAILAFAICHPDSHSPGS